MQRTFLGLSHNPFVPPQEGFYSGADRKAHLDQLRHLSQWSNRVLVVTGPYGIGKSTLYRELSNSLDPKTKGARVSGSVVTSEREVLVGLLQGLGVAFDRNTLVDELERIVIAHIEEQAQAGRVCMAMLDDGHQLEPAAVNRLLQIVAQSALRVVFFAETSLIQVVTSAAKRLDLEWFEIRLSGFPKTDIRGYMEWRFEQAQYRGGLPYTAGQFDKIVARSKGNPHVINQVASQLLSDLEAGEVERPGGFPLIHAVLAVLLVLIVGLVYMLVQPTGELQQSPALVSADRVLDGAVDDSVVKNGAEYLPQLKTPDSQGSENTDNRIGNKPPSSAVVEDTGGTSVAEVVADVAKPTVETELPPVVELTPEVVPVKESVKEQIKEPVKEPEPVKEVAQERVRPEIVQAKPAPTVPEPLPSSVPVIERANGVHGSDWLLRQDPSRYTLQLVTVSTANSAEALVQRQNDKSEFAIYRTKKGDRWLFVVTYGLFSNRAAAVSAAENLTGELGKLNPWIRPLSLVQDAIRQAQ